MTAPAKRSFGRLAQAVVVATGLAPMAGAAAADGLGDYVLVAGDVLRLDFLNENDEPVEMTVSDDGRVQAPLVGGISLAGMTLDGAERHLEHVYVERRMLVDPQIDLSIANYRPIFVLGDVKAPGSFPYQPNLSVVQAVGLAGGPATAVADEEERMLRRANLRTALADVGSEIAREAVWAARLNATLAGRDAIAPADLPEATRPFLNSVFVDTLKTVEERVLSVEARDFDTRRAALEASIAEARNELEIVAQLVERQKESIRFTEEQVERAQTLFDKGLTPRTRVAQLQQAVAAEQTELLRIMAQVSQARRRLGALETDLSSLHADRERGTLLELQERQVAIEKLLSRREAVVDQLALVKGWDGDGAGKRAEVVYDHTIRRRTTEGIEDLAVSELATLRPGDVLIVSRKRRVDQG